MASITLQAQVDDQGRLSVDLPEVFRGEAVMVVIQSHPSSNVAVLEETAGSISGLERPPQVDPLSREVRQ